MPPANEMKRRKRKKMEAESRPLGVEEKTIAKERLMH